MKIFNKTKKSFLATDAQEAKSLKDKSFGLLDPSKPRSLILHTRFGIHTFGMKHAIDVVIVNEKSIIMKLKHELTPNALFTWNPKYSTVIELPTGTITKTYTEVGDILEIV